MNLRNISVRTLLIVSLSIITLYSFIPFIISIYGNKPTSLILFKTLPFIFILYTSFVYLYLTKYLVNPINQIQKTLKIITNGNINEKIEPFGLNCAGKLIPEIQLLQENLLNIIKDIYHSTNDITSNISDILDKNKILKKESFERSSYIQHTVEHTIKLKDFAITNEEESKKTSLVVDSTVNIINESYTNADKLTDSISNIEINTKSIENILSLIKDISFQTNLLSLNASIESARAGIHGRGFSVIASQIRELSNHCEKATKDIHDLVKLSQEETSNVVSLNNKNNQYMKNIQETINNINSIIKIVLINSKEQRISIENIEHSMKSINNKTTKDLKLVEEASCISQNISNNAKNLVFSINQFKI